MKVVTRKPIASAKLRPETHSPTTTLRSLPLRSGPQRRAGRRTLVVSLVLFVIGASACSGSSGLSCPEGSEHFVKYELFMGRSGPDGEVVDDQAWDSFLGDTVTPRFPDGLTVPGRPRPVAGLGRADTKRTL